MDIPRLARLDQFDAGQLLGQIVRDIGDPTRSIGVDRMPGGFCRNQVLDPTFYTLGEPLRLLAQANGAPLALVERIDKQDASFATRVFRDASHLVTS
ncbi:hypothetical protein NG895_28940 [Aeoliella sp. ICT_H6.2]|uniref:Uncharacterized protein n=1 Tax=Aeoliella straminimaris TaxID=2954799 RepID=A0A9X2FFP7_9BACT|nr:hypothetical protein [Aeoliella straminimaris]MCO6047949.1 hypothetical protein [Aeoliella straminimaris]